MEMSSELRYCTAVTVMRTALIFSAADNNKKFLQTQLVFIIIKVATLIIIKLVVFDETIYYYLFLVTHWDGFHQIHCSTLCMVTCGVTNTYNAV
jgi:hypothetical protein